MPRSALAWALWDHAITTQRNQRHTAVLLARRTAGRRGGMRSNWQRAHREQACLDYMPYVQRIARQLRGMFAAHIELADLEAAGYVGLVEAAERYQPANGPFPQYAYFRVRGAIVDSQKRRAYQFAQMESIDGRREQGEGWLPAALEGVDQAPLADEVAGRAIIQDVVQYCISRLESATHQEVIQRILAGQSISEICRQMRRSDKWVKQQSDGAKAELRHYLALEGITSWP